MTIRSLFLLFLISTCCCLNAQNLIVNPGFENTTHESDKPDNWLRRFDNYHHIETNSANVYSGSKCAKFNNDSGSDQECYYYSNYNIDHTTPNFPSVLTGETYELSIKYKVDAAFTGKGISVEIFFNEGNNFIGSADAVWGTSTTWSTIKTRGKVLGSVNKISVAVCYDGKGIAWVDDVQLIKISDPLCTNGSFEFDTASPTDKPDYWLPRMTNYHHVETNAANTYLGNKAALFNNTSGTSESCYYYGPYSADGSTSNYISVCPGDSYTISGFGRASTAFIGSYGVRLAIFFWNNSTYVSSVYSPFTASTTWTPLTQDGTVPAGANKMCYAIEYIGRNSAWVDEVRVVPKNLVKNSSFETDVTSPSDLPDYWLPRSTNYHHVDAAVAYEGSNSAQFNNTSGANYECYFYGPANAASASLQLMDVMPKETYTFSAWGKVASDFTGTGIRVSIVFYNDGVYVSRVDSGYSSSANWTQMSVQATVPATGVNQMCYTIEYAGQKKAWFDRAELYRTDAWYYQAAPISSLEALTFTPPAKLAGSTVLNLFYTYMTAFDNCYNGDGSWNVGYGTQAATSQYPNGHPLIRTTANAVIGYLTAYNKLDTAHKAVASARAQAGLEWLLTQQNANGSFPWWWSNPPISGGGAELYESGLAGQALALGYQFFVDTRYRTASTNVCNYFLTVPPSSNANFNAFAISALAANYTLTGSTDFLDRAVLYMNAIITYQLDSGMLSDNHNEYIWYHSLIAKSMVDLLSVLPDTYPKKAVISQSLYRALNYIRRMENHVVDGGSLPTWDPALGLLLVHPVNTPIDIIYDPNTTMAVTKAYTQLGITSLGGSLDALTVGTQGLAQDTTDAFAFPAFGIMLDYYY